MIKFVWILALQICIISHLYSQYSNFNKIDNPTSLITRIKNKSNSTKLFSGEVEVHYSQKFNINNHTEKANLFFLKPNSFAWKFTSTNTYTIIVSKDKAQTNENGFIEKYNLNRNTDFKFINEIFSAYYNGNLFYSKAYKTSQYKDNFTYLIRLIPLKDNTYNNIELLINKIDLGLVEIRLNKADNSVISYTFNHRIINGVIDEGTFTFE